MRFDKSSGEWKVAIEKRPNLQEVSLNRIDYDFSGEAVYYLRLEQSNLTHGRPVRVWSSPILVSTE